MHRRRIPDGSGRRLPNIDVLVGLDRIELSTSPLSGVRSSQLSYRPFLWKRSVAELRDNALMGVKLVELVGIEPATS